MTEGIVDAFSHIRHCLETMVKWCWSPEPTCQSVRYHLRLTFGISQIPSVCNGFPILRAVKPFTAKQGEDS